LKSIRWYTLCFCLLLFILLFIFLLRLLLIFLLRLLFLLLLPAASPYPRHSITSSSPAAADEQRVMWTQRHLEYRSDKY
jgi:hypothetical protein